MPQKLYQSGAICGEMQVDLVAIPVAELHPFDGSDVRWQVEVVVLDVVAELSTLDSPARDLNVGLGHAAHGGDEGGRDRHT